MKINKSNILPDSSLYPWSRKTLSYNNGGEEKPFPRYGAAANNISSKDGTIYIMGGLVKGSTEGQEQWNTVKGDFWQINISSNGQQFNCLPITTIAEGPGPRVGHASLLVGNAFIVFGGDSKFEADDVLDDTLYLLNTSKF